MKRLRDADAMKYTIVVAGTASDVALFSTCILILTVLWESILETTANIL
jgi:hypothetical protein